MCGSGYLAGLLAVWVVYVTLQGSACAWLAPRCCESTTVGSRLCVAPPTTCSLQLVGVGLRIAYLGCCGKLWTECAVSGLQAVVQVLWHTNALLGRGDGLTTQALWHIHNSRACALYCWCAFRAVHCKGNQNCALPNCENCSLQLRLSHCCHRSKDVDATPCADSNQPATPLANTPRDRKSVV